MQNQTHILRAALLKKGFTIRSFAAKHGFSENTVHAAIRNLRPSGKINRKIMKKIKEVSHVS